MLSRLRKIGIATSLAAAFAAASLAFVSDGFAGGETRTLSLKHVHTGETLTVTYKKNGRYIPSAMARINYIMRDWRKNQVITIDPRTVDLMWELYADLGSKKPIHIICGYRSASTNGMLKRIGRNVAKKSQHTEGKAIDLYFPDVPLAKLRNSAIVREVGGVGYYPAGEGGFVHIDSGHVRYWPRPTDSQIAQIFRDYKSTIGARMRGESTLLAMREVPESGKVAKDKKPAGATSLVASLFGTGEDEEAVAPVATTAATPPIPRMKPVLAAAAPEIPLPKQKPAILAAVEPTIIPVSAPPDHVDFAAKPSVTLTPRAEPAPVAERPAEDANPQSNGGQKGGLLAPVRVQPRVLTASLDTSPDELRAMLEKLQDQDERDDELQQAETKGGPSSNVMAKADRLMPGDVPSLRVQKLGLADPLFDPAKPLPFPVE